MKKNFSFCLALFLLFASFAFAQEDDASSQAHINFLNETQIKEHIFEFFKQNIPNRLVARVYLLAIAKSNANDNAMDVFFIEGNNPSAVKDFYGNISSKKEKIYIAKFDYNLLKNKWYILSLNVLEDERIFKAE